MIQNRQFITMTEHISIHEPNIVVIGGGTGTAAIYPRIAELTPNATALISMSDSGGSSGRLMREFNGLDPLGDLSQVIIAASNNEAVRAMLQLRYPGEGSLAGHSTRNLALAGFVLEHGLEDGVDLFSQAMQSRGTILPITLERNRLVMEDGPGNLISGEHHIDGYAPACTEPRIWLEPAAKINPRAEEAIVTSDLVVVAAGSPYTSQLAALGVCGVREALAASSALKVLVANLVNEPHDTPGWHVVDYVYVLKRHGVSVDYVLYNTTIPTQTVRARYKAEGKEAVVTSAERFLEIPTVRAIGASLLSAEVVRPNSHDEIRRSPIRHDPVAVAEQLQFILASLVPEPQRVL